MKADTFGELVESMNQALEHAQGKRSLRTTSLPRPPAPFNGVAVKRVRESLHASQAVFAQYLNVSTKLVQAWEANRRVPEGPALVLLHVAARQPGLIEAIRHDSSAEKSPGTKAKPARARRSSSASDDDARAAGRKVVKKRHRPTRSRTSHALLTVR
jgi:putative transcriptional regulator